MDKNLITICCLTFVIHLIGTLAYAARIAGVRTRSIATAMTLFNLFILVSRTANTFQAPFLAKRIETTSALLHDSVLSDLRWILSAAVLATIVGGLLTPSAQRVFTLAVGFLSKHRSIWLLLIHSGKALKPPTLRKVIAFPKCGSLPTKKQRMPLSFGYLTLNIVAMSLWTVGVFASLYAGSLEPDLRVTCSQLASMINGIATIVMFLLLDPQLALLTDDVVRGRLGESAFRSAISTLIIARLMGVGLSQFVVEPAAIVIVAMARIL